MILMVFRFRDLAIENEDDDAQPEITSGVFNNWDGRKGTMGEEHSQFATADSSDAEENSVSSAFFFASSCSNIPC